MKKVQLVLVALMLMGVASVATAQDPQPQPQGQGGGRMNRGPSPLFQGITLSADQQVMIDSIGKTYGAKRQAIVADQSIEGPAKRTKIMELMTKQQEEIKCVLTAEQKTVYEKNIADMEARRQQGGGQRPPQK
jgi:Spy/CpxP family protein refolding chaperone